MTRMGFTRAPRKGVFGSTIARSAMTLSLAVAGVAPLGCANRPAPTPPPTTNPTATEQYGLRQGETMVDLTAQSATAEQRAAAFKPLVVELEQSPYRQQRPALRKIFVALSDTLPIFAGSHREGVFAHQLGAVTQVRDQLATLAPEQPDAGLVDSGLAAAYNAMRDLSFTRFYQNEKLTALLGELHTKVTSLPYSSGADHAILLIATVKQFDEAIGLMAGTLKERAATLTPSVAAPTTVPASPATPTDPAAPPAPAPVPTDPATPTPPAPAPTDPTAPATPPAPAEPTVPTPPPADPAAPAVPPADPAVPAPATVDPAAPVPTPAPAPTDPAAPTVPPTDPATPTEPAAPTDGNK